MLWIAVALELAWRATRPVEDSTVEWIATAQARGAREIALARERAQ
jgi:hypothetical protein